MVSVHFGDPRAPERIWMRISPEPNTGCWFWLGACNVRSKRYDDRADYEWPRAMWNGRNTYVYRIFHEIMFGKLPPRTDRTCQEQRCVNPDHWRSRAPSRHRRRSRSRRRDDLTDTGQKRLRNSQLVYKYGITLCQFEEMLLAQDNRCAICWAIFGAGICSARIDHDHVSGAIRGLLCDWCNRGIGSLREDPVVADAAAAYLRRHK